MKGSALNPKMDPSVYVVTSAGHMPGRGHVEVARAALEGGATTIQLRAPELDDETLVVVARRLSNLIARTGKTFMVNNRIDVVLEVGADGVHLGQDDNPASARKVLGPGPILGISVATPQQASDAEAFCADYLAVTVWATSTKPEAKAVGLEGLRTIVAATTLPVVGIGGIDASNAGDVIRAGAAGVAVISAVGAAHDPVAAARALVGAVEMARRQR